MNPGTHQAPEFTAKLANPQRGRMTNLAMCILRGKIQSIRGHATMSSANRTYRTWIEAASLVIGPPLMSAGGLVHPKEKMNAADQVAILVDLA